MDKKHINVSFFLDLFFNNKDFPPFYKKVTNSFTESVICKTNSNFKIKHATYSISDIPDYFSIEFIKPNKRLKSLTTSLYSGYLINLTSFKNFEDYLNNKLGRPRKSQLKRYKKRLDLCIAPEYKIFYGDISKDTYHLLFKNLFLMTERRFAQKEELNFELPYLELYHDMMYPLILNKKACIFAIYHNNKPINITLNFIDGDTIFHWNSSYNIDYQMFNLGHINIVNHLEWAFQNGFKLFDMGRGDFLHKRKYVNENYMYNEQVIYDSKSLSASIIAYIKIIKLKTRFEIIQFLKKNGVHLWYGIYAKYKYRLIKAKSKPLKEIKPNIDNTVSKIPKLESLNTIDLSKDEYVFLIKPLNYFLHKSQELVTNVRIYSDINNKEIFYFKGLKKIKKIVITNQKKTRLKIQMSKKNKITIFPVLFRTPVINHLYESIEYFGLNVVTKSSKCIENDILTFRLVPEYFKLNLRDTSFKSKIIPQYNWGYSILLEASDSIDGFMQRHFNSKKRNIFTRYIKRLESCFNIKYKMFYGDICSTDYNFIMQSLYNMIIDRFKERNEIHKNLFEWQALLENTYQNIINKEASLFVIYNENEPIEISLNYHFDKVLFSYVSSFNIDYSKFGLGHIEIYKQIEWCANNGYKLFEMGVGGMDYKRRWSNNIYRYNHYVIYKRSSIQSKYKAQLLVMKIQLKEFLKSKGLNEIYSKINSYFTKRQNEQSNIVQSEIKVINDLDITNLEEIQQNTTDEYLFLKKHIYDFLYTTTGHLNDIKIYKYNAGNSFLIKDAKNYQKIIFNT